ncbi:hypothetical protein DL93DRAFT_2170082 [Clavulina sp. PMI_390]|nr:hypothetical protein DL93DRAFT_2170082 [Clavulina sp. PMI_390]
MSDSALPPGAASSTSSVSLTKLYITANAATFMHASTESAVESFPTYFSRSLSVVQNGKAMTYDELLNQMKGAKGMWPVIDVRYKMLTESADSREVATAEYIWIPSEKMWFDTIIVLTFGAVGSEDEHKVIKWVEVMTPGPKAEDRDPESAEAKSVA